MAIDIDKLAADIFAALNAAIQGGIKTGRAFIRKQSRGLAVQGAMIAEARLGNNIDDDDVAFFNTQLAALTKNFARSVVAMALITLQNAWNAIVGVLWGTINAALAGANFGGLPVPKVPKI